MAVRTTVNLDEGLLERLRRFVPQRGLSRFVNQAMAEKVEALERQAIEASMVEGYLASWEEQKDIDEDWGVSDIEGWPRE
jgi:metal-responsive CopG/Arc/MetJ family transcriptional regulator